MNLISMLKDTVGDTLANQASSFLGESQEGTSKAVGAILPSILGSFVNKGSDEQGASAIIDAIKGGGFDGSMLNNIGSMFGGGNETTNLLNSGSGILNMIMGDKVSGIISAISGFAGIKRSSSSSLMSLAAPLVMSMLGKQVSNKGLGASGLMDMLTNQKDHIQNAMPAGFSAGGLLEKFTGAASGAVTGAVGLGKDAVSGTVNTGKKVVSGTVDTGRKVVGGAANMTSDAVNTATGGGWLKWILGGIVLLAILSLLGYNTCIGDKVNETAGSLMDKTGELAGDVVEGTKNVAGSAADMAGKAADGVSNAAGAVADGVSDAAGAVADGVSNAASLTGDALSGAFNSVNEAGQKALSSVKFAAGSAGSQVMDFINGGFKGDNRFTFKNLNFASGSAEISGTSGVEVDKMAAILEAYPDINIIVEGYTDNTGDADANKALSLNRAEAVKARLVDKGIAADRINVAGYGSANPVGDNATAEGKEANRRIEFRII